MTPASTTTKIAATAPTNCRPAIREWTRTTGTLLRKKLMAQTSGNSESLGGAHKYQCWIQRTTPFRVVVTILRNAFPQASELLDEPGLALLIETLARD